MSTLLWIVTIIVAYIIIVCLLIRWINKMTKDSKTIMGSLYEAINTYILNINTTLATQKNSIPKFNDLIEVVYAKKKRFLNRATHPLLDRYEFFIWLKDDIKYLSEYTNQSLINEPLNQQTQQYFSFLFQIKPRQKVLRFCLWLCTLGVWLWFVDDGVKL